MSLRERTRPGLGLIEVCLPSPAKTPPSGSGWIHEIKHDGFRIMARRDGAGVRFLLRGHTALIAERSRSGRVPGKRTFIDGIKKLASKDARASVLPIGGLPEQSTYPRGGYAHATQPCRSNKSFPAGLSSRDSLASPPAGLAGASFMRAREWRPCRKSELAG